MKCPQCSKPISDDAAFCGYCGAAIKKEPAVISQSISSAKQEKQTPRIIEVPPAEKAIRQKKNLRVRAFVAALLFLLAAGAALGYFAARQGFDIMALFSPHRIDWSYVPPAEKPAEAAPMSGDSADEKQPEAQHDDAQLKKPPPSRQQRVLRLD